MYMRVKHYVKAPFWWRRLVPEAKLQTLLQKKLPL